MDERLRAALIVEIAERGDMGLLKSFAYDMILNAKSEERERCAKVAEDFGAQAGNDSSGGMAHVIAQQIRTAQKAD